MSLEVGFVGSRILVETGSLHDIFQHTAYVTVNIFHAELAFLHTLDNLLDLRGLSRLHEVVAGMYLSDGGQSLADTNPVGHYNAFVAPVFTQNAGKQVVVAH